MNEAKTAIPVPKQLLCSTVDDLKDISNVIYSKIKRIEGSLFSDDETCSDGNCKVEPMSLRSKIEYTKEISIETLKVLDLIIEAL